MGLFGQILDRLMTPAAVPERCPCCRDTNGLISASGGGWFHDDCCGKDFTGVRDAADDWVFDLRPARERARQAQRMTA